jgi:hypothetical protein
MAPYSWGATCFQTRMGRENLIAYAAPSRPLERAGLKIDRSAQTIFVMLPKTPYRDISHSQ